MTGFRSSLPSSRETPSEPFGAPELAAGGLGLGEAPRGCPAQGLEVRSGTRSRPTKWAQNGGAQGRVLTVYHNTNGVGTLSANQTGARAQTASRHIYGSSPPQQDGSQPAPRHPRLRVSERRPRVRGVRYAADDVVPDRSAELRAGRPPGGVTRVSPSPVPFRVAPPTAMCVRTIPLDMPSLTTPVWFRPSGRFDLGWNPRGRDQHERRCVPPTSTHQRTVRRPSDLAGPPALVVPCSSSRRSSGWIWTYP